jgi:hypothetical protein
MTLTRTAPMISFETLWNDLWQAYRQIRNAPGFAGAVILVLAAGFGISTAIFSTVRSVILTPLPYNKPERLVQIVSRWPKTGDKNDWSAPLRDAPDWKATVPAFQDVAMYPYSLLHEQRCRPPITTFRPAQSNFEVARSSKSSHHQLSCYERTPKLLAFQLRQLCGQRRPTNRLRCCRASFRSY